MISAMLGKRVLLEIWTADRFADKEAELIDLAFQQSTRDVPGLEVKRLYNFILRGDAPEGKFSKKRWQGILEASRQKNLGGVIVGVDLKGRREDTRRTPYQFDFTCQAKYDPFKGERCAYEGRSLQLDMATTWAEELSPESIVERYMPVLDFAVQHLKVLQASIRMSGIDEIDALTKQFHDGPQSYPYRRATERVLYAGWLTFVHERIFDPFPLQKRFDVQRMKIKGEHFSMIRLAPTISQVTPKDIQDFLQTILYC